MRAKPDSQHKLSALLNDVAGSDTELVSAFRLLFGNPVCVSLFIAGSPLGAAERSALNSIAKSSLSPSLSLRTEEFIRGYFDRAVSESPGLDLSRQSIYYVGKSSSNSALSSVVPASSALAEPEEATLFASDDSSFDQLIKPDIQGGAASFRLSPARQIPLKPFALLLLATLMGILMFKLQAICEPFGLCAKEQNQSKDKNGGRQPESKDLPPSVSKPSQSIDASAPPRPRDLPALRSPAPPSPIQPQRPLKTPYIPAPSPESAPLREEPLW